MDRGFQELTLRGVARLKMLVHRGAAVKLFIRLLSDNSFSAKASFVS
jgi:hypothetical protein